MDEQKRKRFQTNELTHVYIHGMLTLQHCATLCHTHVRQNCTKLCMNKNMNLCMNTTMKICQTTELNHEYTHGMSTLQQCATRCNTVQHTVQHCATLCITVQHCATLCNTVQHCATLCNALQHSATRCNTPTHSHVWHDSFKCVT